METITLSYTSAAGTLTRTRSLPDGTASRIIAATIKRLGMATGSTNAAVFSALADEIFQVLRQNVLGTETNEAHKTASASIVDITIT